MCWILKTEKIQLIQLTSISFGLPFITIVITILIIFIVNIIIIVIGIFITIIIIVSSSSRSIIVINICTITTTVLFIITNICTITTTTLFIITNICTITTTIMFIITKRASALATTAKLPPELARQCCKTQFKGWVALSSFVCPVPSRIGNMSIYANIYRFWALMPVYIYNIFRRWWPFGDHLVTAWRPLADHWYSSPQHNRQIFEPPTYPTAIRAPNISDRYWSPQYIRQIFQPATYIQIFNMFKTSTFDHRRKQEASNCNAAKYIFLQTIEFYDFLHFLLSFIISYIFLQSIEFYDFLIGAQLLPFRYLIRVMERRKDKTLNDKEKSLTSWYQGSFTLLQCFIQHFLARPFDWLS